MIYLHIEIAKLNSQAAVCDRQVEQLLLPHGSGWLLWLRPLFTFFLAKSSTSTS
jgi:hypothetical protein